MFAIKKVVCRGTVLLRHASAIYFDHIFYCVRVCIYCIQWFM